MEQMDNGCVESDIVRYHVPRKHHACTPGQDAVALREVCTMVLTRKEKGVAEI